MSMNCPVVPAKSMRAFTDMGVLLSMVLRSKGISVPLWSEVKWTKTGVGLEGWGFQAWLFWFSDATTVGSTYLLGTLLCLSLVLRTYWSLWGMGFTVDWPKNPL